MARLTREDIVAALLVRHGQTFADEIGFAVADKPVPLFQLLVASLLFGAPMRSSAAVRAARALFHRGWTTPEKLARAQHRSRVAALRGAGYARFDERTSVLLGACSDMVIEEYGGDLRKLRALAGSVPAEERRLLKRLHGIGELGADIFFRSVQECWDEISPFADARAIEAARALRLPVTAKGLSALTEDLPLLVDALVRCALAGDAAEVLQDARGS